MPALSADLSTFIAFRSGVTPNRFAQSLSLDSFLSIKGEDSECRRSLGAVLVRLADRNAPEVVSKQDVMAAIGHSIEAEKCPIQWQGVSLLRLAAPVVPVELSDLTKQAAEQLKAALSDQFQDVVISPVELLQPPASVAPGTQFKVLPPVLDRVSRRMVVDIAVEEPGHAVWRLPIWFSVSARKAALRAPHDLGIHQDLSHVPMQSTVVDWAAIDGMAIPADFDLMGYWASSPIAGGAVLKMGDLAHRPDVVVGEPVVLRFSANNVVVETSALALQSGFVGDRVLVRNERSHENIMGEIDKPGNVEVGP